MNNMALNLNDNYKQRFSVSMAAIQIVSHKCQFFNINVIPDENKSLAEGSINIA